VRTFFAVRPHQHNDSGLEPSQANQPLLAVRIPVILSGQHRRIENGLALGQVDRVFAQIELSLGRVIAHLYLSYMRLISVATVPPGINFELQQ
jgi:hypothetical protein